MKPKKPTKNERFERHQADIEELLETAKGFVNDCLEGVFPAKGSEIIQALRFQFDLLKYHQDLPNTQESKTANMLAKKVKIELDKAKIQQVERQLDLFSDKDDKTIEFDFTPS